MNKTDSALGIAIVVGLGIVAYVLSKSGVFKLTTKVADVAGNVVTDVYNLPENLIALPGLLADLPLAIAQHNAEPVTTQSIFDYAIQGKVQTFPGAASINQRTANMIQSVYTRYPGVTADNWSQVSVAHGAKFDQNGFIISDNGTGLNTVTSGTVNVTSPELVNRKMLDLGIW